MIVDSGGSTLLTRYYFDGKYEIDGVKGNAAQRLFIGGDAYSAPAVYVKEENSSEWKIYYICRDYLGSITHIANADGTLKQELSYDAWGRLRNPETQVAYAPGTEPALFLGRGYTGHEHLPQFGLINMNARLYDAALGRFLSPDPYVQMPDFTQNFNRYSYCLNNPLVYSDLTGEWFGLDDLIAGLFGGSFNLIINIIEGNVHSFGQGVALFGSGFAGAVVTIYVGPALGAAVTGAGNSIINQGFNGGWNNINWNQVLGAGIMSGVTSVAGSYLSDYFSNALSSLMAKVSSPVLKEMLTQSLTNAASGFVLGTGSSLLSGESFEDALHEGGKGALTGAGIGAITGAASGFKYARDNKISPWTGEKTQKHHSDPIFLGGEKRQTLTNMSTSRHISLHKELNANLKNIHTEQGFDMSPRRNNPGSIIREKFSRELRIGAMKNFYDSNRFKYFDARYDFYKNNNLRWTPW